MHDYCNIVMFTSSPASCSWVQGGRGRVGAVAQVGVEIDPCYQGSSPSGYFFP